MHAGGHLAEAGEVQHAVQRRLRPLVAVGAGELGSDDSLLGLRGGGGDEGRREGVRNLEEFYNPI